MNRDFDNPLDPQNKAPKPGTSTEDLAAYYPFNGNANDESGNGNHGTVNGLVLTEDRFNIPNRAYRFNGTNGYIQVADDPSLDIRNENTLSAWINPTLSGAGIRWNGIISKGRDVSENYELLIHSNGSLHTG
jgi:hypothetical protein